MSIAQEDILELKSALVDYIESGFYRVELNLLPSHRKTEKGQLNRLDAIVKKINDPQLTTSCKKMTSHRILARQDRRRVEQPFNEFAARENIGLVMHNGPGDYDFRLYTGRAMTIEIESLDSTSRVFPVLFVEEEIGNKKLNPKTIGLTNHWSNVCLIFANRIEADTKGIWDFLWEEYVNEDKKTETMGDSERKGNSKGKREGDLVNEAETIIDVALDGLMGLDLLFDNMIETSATYEVAMRRFIDSMVQQRLIAVLYHEAAHFDECDKQVCRIGNEYHAMLETLCLSPGFGFVNMLSNIIYGRLEGHINAAEGLYKELKKKAVENGIEEKELIEYFSNIESEQIRKLAREIYFQPLN